MNRSLFLLMTLLSTSIYAADASLKTPNISANTLFLYQSSNFHKEDTDPSNPDQNPNGLNFQEAELQFYSDVDPYTKLNIIISVHPEYEAAPAGVEEKWVFEPEEAYAESIALPATTLKIGKFKAFMGKHNTLHTHAFPFIQAPLANQHLLGDEGLNDAGLSAAFLLPSSWFSELTLQYLRGKGENEEFNSSSPGEGVGLAHWKNLFDLTDDLTMEVGASYASGENSFRKETTLTGADLTFKWRPSEGGRYQSVVWTTEYLGRKRSQSDVPDEKGSGIASGVQYQFAERWAIKYRYDTLKLEESFDPTELPNDTWTRNSVAISFFPSEFSSFKLEYDQTRGGLPNAAGDTMEQAIFLQANFTIGSHPSHAY